MVKEFGRFQIQKQLGYGGFGLVYQAYDPLMRRQVAIKVLAPEANPEALKKFELEAGTTARLSHKNVVRVYQFAQEQGRPYLVMELLQGQTLQELINSSPSRSLLEKVGILYAVAEGLDYAHGQGVIHRDVKPLNIMVNADLEVKIMDFGTAAMFGSDGTRRSREDDVLGTIAYMAPEWFNGAPVGRKADLFAYGVVCYEFLTGNHPFRAENDTTTASRISIHEPEPIRAAVEGCPERLDALVTSLLEKDPEMRCGSFKDVLLDLRLVLEELKDKRAQELFEVIPGRLADGDLTGAKEAVYLVLELMPEHAAGRALLDEIRRREQRRAVQQRVQGMKTRAGKLMAEGDITGAIDVLDAAFELDQVDSELPRLIEQARSEQECRRKVNQLLAEAHTDERSQNLEAALDKSFECLRLDPGNKQASELVARLEEKVEAIQKARREQQERQRMAEEARKQAEQEIREGVLEALRADNLDEAERRLSAAKEHYGSNDFWRSLANEYKSRQQYLLALLMAEKAAATAANEQVRDILRPFERIAPDGRAKRILDSLEQRQSSSELSTRVGTKARRIELGPRVWLIAGLLVMLVSLGAILMVQRRSTPNRQKEKAPAQTVEKKPAQASLPTLPTPPPASPAEESKEERAPDDQALIRQAIEAYAGAIGRKSESALRRAWPTIPDVDLHLWHDSFEKTETLKFSLQPIYEAEITGDSARLRCRRKVNKVYTDGRPTFSDSGVVNVSLRRRGAGWILTSVSAP